MCCAAWPRRRSRRHSFDYIAELAVVPATPAQDALKDEDFDPGDDENALRHATVNFLRDQDAVFDVRVQLCVDLDRMPVENANTEWPEALSPYVTVSRLTIPRQEAYTEARRRYVDDALSFCVSHSLAAHRPLGSLQRARLAAYPHMAKLRREANGTPVQEPTSVGDVPA